MGQKSIRQRGDPSRALGSRMGGRGFPIRLSVLCPKMEYNATLWLVADRGSPICFQAPPLQGFPQPQ